MATTPILVRPLIQVNTANGGGTDQKDGQIVGLDDGGYVIVYNDQSHIFSTGEDVLGQRFDAAGNKIGSERQIITAGSANRDYFVDNGAAITNLHNGNIAVAYTEAKTNITLNITLHFIDVRILNSALDVVSEVDIDVDDAQQKNASITSFSDGSYVVSYTLDNGNGNNDILAKIVSASGTVGGVITVRDNGVLDADLSQVATLSNNRFVVVYQQLLGNPADHDIYFGIYTPSGVPVTTDRSVFGGSSFFEETDPDVAALVGGGFVVGWTDSFGDASGQGVRMSIYDNAGNLVAGDIQINTTTAGNQNEVSLVALKDGGFVATWEDDNAFMVRGQRFDATGHMIGSEFLVKNNVHNGQPNDSPDSALLTDGRFAYALGSNGINGGDIDVTTSIWDPRTPRDFGADGHSDILWRNDNGAASIWDSGQIGNAHIISNAGVVPTSWHMSGKGDFDGNGHSDILWRNDNGAASIWDNGQIGGAHIIAAAGVIPSGWNIAGTGDFDGNGHSDILWRNDNGAASIWDDGQIGSAHIISAAGVVPNSWHIAGTGDFDGNGHSDILWRNDNGAASIWDDGQIGNAHIISAAGVVPNSWHISGTGDFDGNGHDDILWRNDNGAVSIWNDGQIGGAHIVSDPGVVANSWHISDTGDYDGNGYADILWRNDNGAVSIWDYGVLIAAHIVSGPGVVTSDWHIA